MNDMTKLYTMLAILAMLIAAALTSQYINTKKPKESTPATESAFYRQDRDEQFRIRVQLEQQNALLRQQIQQYQAAVEKVNARLRSAAAKATNNSKTNLNYNFPTNTPATAVREEAK